MQETVQLRLESARKELLDLGLRNPLLNYRITKGKGVHITNEHGADVYDLLVTQQKAMTFLSMQEGEPNYRDTRLQTDEEEQKLQSRLLNTYYFARTSIEEQGVNLLYLALGFLHWYEPADPDTLRSAPLVLVPVNLERSSAQERFRLSYTGSEIGSNLSLQAKMKADFNITIPDIAEEDFNYDAYLEEVGSYIQRETSWSVAPDEIELGFFSFGKFLIYNDLDTSLWPKAQSPEQNPNVDALLNTGFHEDVPEEENDLDTDTKANELYRVVDADSSQLLAMLSVQEGTNLVIQGPPGTGKSQTITNIIANAVGQGKKVLFVAEKMAALEVVKRRLDNIQLGVACLELHSHKANKRELLAELKRVMDLGKPQTELLELEIQRLEIYRTELNEYCQTINAPIAGTGLTIQQVIGYLLQINRLTENKSLAKIAIPEVEKWDLQKMITATAAAEGLQARLNHIGVPAQLRFYGSKLMLVMEHHKPELKGRLETALRAVSAFNQQLQAIATETKFTLPANAAELSDLLNLLAQAAKAPDLSGLMVTETAWQSKAADISELLRAGKQLEQIYRDYQNSFVAEAWSQDIVELRRNLVSYGNKWHRSFHGDYRKSKQQLAGLLKVPLPNSAAEQLQLVDAISEARRLEKILLQYDAFAQSLFGPRWQKQQSDWNALENAAQYLSTVNDALQAYLAHSDAAQAAAYLKSVTQLSYLADEEIRQALNALQVATFPTKYIEQQTGLQDWVEHFADLQLVIDWNQLTEHLNGQGLDFLVKATLDWPEAKDLLKVSLEKSWYEFLIERAFNLNRDLTRFERSNHEDVIAKFKRLDEVNLYYNRARVALKHWESLPPANAGGQVNVLKTEFNKKARHLPIRKLVETAGKAMQAIKPVWMMSPMSIANFLPPGAIEFDLVIFDEASQVRPVDAIGAIARGKQLVVVGDTKQLPPTSFFDKLNTEIEEEENVTADMQSILGLCDGQGAPTRMLRWHYRSQHESLITLSNHEFYEDKLVIFPSPGSKQNLGLKFHHLPEAIYDRGQSRTNPIEAQTVAKAVIAHAKNHPTQSLGVVAFSTSQAQAIQQALETERKAHPETESYFISRPDEPFFIKNLENVQGDERDVILISIGYGRTAEGKVPMNFGPLNNEGGERRLNVLITRAKMRCEVFSNITSEDIKVGEVAKRGIRSLKSFLYFAQFARFDTPDAILSTAPRPFEDEVAAQLTKAGYTVRNQVGTPGFYLDLAIVDPENPGRYLLGIECDGKAYASAISATDRDRLRTQVLERFGWRLYRVWSTDWYRNPSRELQRLIDAIETAKTQIQEQDIEREEFHLEIDRAPTTKSEIGTTDYQLTDLHIEHLREEFQLYTFEEIGSWIEQIAQTEGPVHLDELSKRIAEAAGLSKVTSRVKYTITQALHQAKVRITGDFISLPDRAVQVRNRSKLPASFRKLNLIAPEELQEAVRQVVTAAISITEQEAIPLIAGLLGFSRLTEEMRQTLSDAIGKAIQSGAITFEGLSLKAAL